MEPANIVIRGPNWLGDSVLSVPAIKAVRARFPLARITMLVRPDVAGLFRSVSFVDAVQTVPGPGQFGQWISATRDLSRGGFDFALLFPNSFESALIAFGARIPERAGYATDARGFLLTRTIPVPAEKQHQVSYYLRLVESVFDIGDSEPDVEITATVEARHAARQLLHAEARDTDGGFLVLCPGAAYGSAKRWFEERFARVADRIAEESRLQTVIVGSEGERAIAIRVRDYMRHPALILTGRTDLETLIGLLSMASIVITNDSGPMHVSAALGTPTVAIFGSTDAEVTRPLGPRTQIVRHDVACSPCLLRECPIDHRCMDAVSIDDVSNAVRSLELSRAP